MAGLDRSRDALFVERLHAKTLARGLNWSPTAHDGRFQARVGEFVVEVGEGAGAEHEVLICRADGQALEMITPASLGPAAADALAETWEGARRRATGVDHAIDSLIAELA